MGAAGKEAERAELHKTIWRIANDLRGSVDGWEERKAGSPDFDYATLSDAEAERGRRETVAEKGFYILPSELFAGVRERARHDENLNETLAKVFATPEPRARPRDRRQHVPDRLRRDHAEHALGRQGPPRARPHPGRRGESADRMFIALFGAIVRLRNILTSFDEFAGNELLSERDYQDYLSFYLDLHAELRRAADSEKESIVGDVVLEIELVKQVEVNVDYVLMLVEQYRDERGNGADRELEALATIRRAIDSSISLRNKRDLILAFVEEVSASSDVKGDWRRFVETRRDEELDRIIADEGLAPDEARAFVERDRLAVFFDRYFALG